MAKKILIVEDEKATLQALSRKVEGAGFDVVTADDGQIGLDKALSEHPDLILLDLILPKLDGMSVLENLRKDEWGKNVPVLILSNLGTGDEFEKSRENNVREFLIKTDWSLEDVIDKIKENLEEE